MKLILSVFSFKTPLLKSILMMKMVIFLLIASCIQVQAAGQKVSLSKTNAPLKEIFRSIEKQSGFLFMYETGLINQDMKATVKVRDAEIDRVMNECLKGTSLSYTIVGKSILINKSGNKAKGPVPVPEVETVINRIITGRVTDSKGNPLEGASVFIKSNEKVGTITNKEGKFTINLPPDAKVLRVNFIGYKSTDITVVEKSNYDVRLEPESTKIEDVVITGYQQIDKRNNTSAITTLIVGDLLVPGMTSIDQLLEGNVPELMFMTNSGELGSTPRIRVRGTSTLLGSREPLWVLDGFVMQDPVAISNEDLNSPDYVNIIGNAIAGINPQDIERVDILKDASATALYGTRAANGVVVVTTKRGKVGKPSVSLTQQTKVSQRPRYSDKDINLMNSAERVDFGQELTDLHYAFPGEMSFIGYEGAYYRYQTGEISFEQFQKEVDTYSKVNEDWFDVLTHDAFSFDQTLSVSGGSEDTRYYASFGYNKENGVLKNTMSNRFTGRVNLNSSFLNNKLQMNVSLSGSDTKRNNQQQAIKTVDYAYNTTRALPVYDEEGELNFYGAVMYNHGVPYNQYKFNILNEIDNSSVDFSSQNVNSILSLRYKPTRNFDVEVSGNYSSSASLQESWWGEKTQYVARYKNGEWNNVPRTGDKGYSYIPYGGILGTSNSQAISYTFRTQFNYRKSFGPENKHNIQLLGGFETYETRNSSVSNENRGYLKDRGKQFVDKLDLELYPHYAQWINQNHTHLNENLTRTVSGYSVVSYSFKNFFTLNANTRFDISNKFGSRSNERLLPVWSISGMSNFKNLFLKDVDFFDNFTARASFGIQGNMLDNQSPNFVIKLGTINPLYNEYVAYSERIPNPNLRWEQTKQWSFGSDMEMFNRRLSMGVSLYGKHTKDAFSTVSVALENGVEAYVMNAGAISNVGYSVSLGFYPLKFRDFSWYFSTYYGGNLNRVQSDNASVYTIGNYLNGTALVNGEAIGTFYSYIFEGLNSSNGTPVIKDFEDRQHLLENLTLEETVQMVMQKSGSREPNISGSFTNRFTYKRLSVSVMMSYSLGGKVRLFELYRPIVSGVKAENNVRKELVDRWRVPGDELITNIPAIISPSDPNYKNYNDHFSSLGGADSDIKRYASSLWGMYDNSNIRVVSGDYLKLTSINARYSLGGALLKKLPFNAASISFGARDLVTFSAKELNGQTPMQAGFDKPNLSLRPSYTLQLSLNF